MKAKEYYKRLLIADDRKGVIIENARMFLDEFVDIITARNISTTQGGKRVFDEFQQKWENYCFLVNSKIYPQTNPMRYDGFKKLLILGAPELCIEIGIN